MLPDRVSNPGPLTYESGPLPIALCCPAPIHQKKIAKIIQVLCGFNRVFVSRLMVRASFLSQCKVSFAMKFSKEKYAGPNSNV